MSRRQLSFCILEQFEFDQAETVYCEAIRLAAKYGWTRMRHHVNFLNSVQNRVDWILDEMDKIFECGAENGVVVIFSPFVWNPGFDTEMCKGLYTSAREYLDKLRFRLVNKPQEVKKYIGIDTGNEHWTAKPCWEGTNKSKFIGVMNAILATFPDDIKKSTTSLDVSGARYFEFHSHINKPKIRPHGVAQGHRVVGSGDTGKYREALKDWELPRKFCNFMGRHNLSADILLPGGLECMTTHLENTEHIFWSCAKDWRDKGWL